MSASLASQEVQCLTLERVTSPKVIPMRRLIDDIGYENLLHAMTNLMVQVDLALGANEPDIDRCTMTAATVMMSNSFRSFGFVLVAVKEGLAGGAKGYGKVNTQLIHEWCSTQENKLLGKAESEHAKYTVRGDNYGKDWMDRQEHQHTMKDRKIASMGRVIDDLKNKLNTEKP
jgi:hypothetical protein